jgi:hypothetical protein
MKTILKAWQIAELHPSGLIDYRIAGRLAFLDKVNRCNRRPEDLASCSNKL